jgi:DNA topoisomerase-1
MTRAKSDVPSSIKPQNLRAAHDAGLIYVHGHEPGITRKKSGKSFIYFDPAGRKIEDDETLLRINQLAIPPAYRDVWICADPRGHIQAMGRDDRNRKQYRYHEKWREVRDQNKYDRIIDFARALPRIRKRVARDLARKGLPREKVLAAVVSFMEATLMRVGNDEYAKHNGSYGLTTLQDRHAKITGRRIHLEFRGKSGVEHEFDLNDPRLAHIAKACQDLPGQELFQYLDSEGNVRDIGSSDVNAYLREISGQDFSAKDFRTWAGTVLAAQALRQFEPFGSRTQAKKNIVRAIESVSARLGNTRAVCRKCYIHPEVLNSYLDGSMVENLITPNAAPNGSPALKPEEAEVVELLQRRLVVAARRRRKRAREEACKPKTVREALRRSLKLAGRAGRSKRAPRPTRAARSPKSTRSHNPAYARAR